MTANQIIGVLRIGQRVTWMCRVSGGCGLVLPIAAIVVGRTVHHVAIEALLCDGATTRRLVKPENLKPRHPVRWVSGSGMTVIRLPSPLESWEQRAIQATKGIAS